MTRNRTAVIALATAMVLALGACTASVAGPPPTAPEGWESEMLGAINAHRANVGLPPLAWCATLAGAAQSHSQDQANRMTMTHTGYDGSTIGTRANRAGYVGWRSLAENVAAGQTSVGQVMTSWMGSSGHRANILGGSTHVGFGQARGANGVIYWTQDFGSGGRC
ncbi:CAP domain-containing protein [Dermatobacter hominis]|uniref:CAP domain-containing protein n=1 Tax=Dermatobacter hominis TaxID=2884263 RepID=UPI001D105253|nr:CAP domain-containing protein [Dermatobacter hominis]UDY36800.1 CAP domain-containing protein [Dermatobacter hominis]